MGSGASRRWMTDSHGRLANEVVGTSASPTQLAAGQTVVRQSPASGAPLQTSRASDKDTDDPIPRTDGGGPEKSDGHGGGGGRVTYATLADIFGAEGGDAKYIKRHMIGKGAFGEALVVERNANYNPARYPVIEAQFQRNSLAHLTKPRGLYVAKVMDLHNMPARDRHYAQTEIFCLAHTNHFAVIKYYEHYILDSDDETLVIITEYADHGDLSHYLMQTRLLAMRAAEASNNDNNSHNCATNSATVVRGGGGMNGSGGNGSSTSTVGGGGGGGSETQTSHMASTTNRTLLVEREAGMYFVQLLLALHHIHSRRMIHRDVKSANLFLTSNGVIKLGDFGFSQKYESTVSSESIAGTFLGTPYYLSPEMWQGMRYGKKADIWAAGIVLYEMLMNGRRPFDARTLPELREMVVSSTIVLPEYPPAETNTATNSQCGVGDIAAGAVGSEAAPRPARFSREMRELVQCVFQCDPSRRPSAEELLHMPIMQHYLYVFEKHVQTLIAADDAARAGSVVCDPMTLHFTDEEDKSLLLRCLAEAKLTVAREIQKEIHESAFPRYEGVVYKDNRNNVWKERYLILADNVLTISLGKGKEAVDGTERSKKVPLKMVKAVSPCEPEGVLRDSPTTGTPSQGRTDTNSSYSAVNKAGSGDAASAAAPSSFRPPYAFAISMESSNSIVFGVATAEQLDCWLQTLLRALQMN